MTDSASSSDFEWKGTHFFNDHCFIGAQTRRAIKHWNM